MKKSNKLPKKEDDANNNRKNVTIKPDSVNERQVSDTDSGMIIEGDDSVGWRSLPEILESSHEGDMILMMTIEYMRSFTSKNI